MEELTPIEKIFSEDNNENVVLYNGEDKSVEFEQIAVVPLEDNDYCILKPVVPFDGMTEKDALVFRLVEDEEEGTASIELEQDEEVVDQVFDVYYQLLDEALAEELGYEDDLIDAEIDKEEEGEEDKQN